MTLYPPFIIGPRLAPAVAIGEGFLTYDDGSFVLDVPGIEHRITDFNPGHNHNLVDQFVAILSFLAACAESRSYAERRGKEPMEGENSGLFPEDVGQWAQKYSDEISMLGIEIEESAKDKVLIENQD